MSPQRVVGHVNAERAGKMQNKKKTAFSISVTENGKALFHFSALLQAHSGNPPRL